MNVIFSIAYYCYLNGFIMGCVHWIPFAPTRIMTRVFAVLGFQIATITVLVGLIFRLIHTGKVCSGDYLNETDSTKGYLISQGWLLMLIIYIWMYIMMSCFGSVICIVIVCIPV